MDDSTTTMEPPAHLLQQHGMLAHHYKSYRAQAVYTRTGKSFSWFVIIPHPSYVAACHFCPYLYHSHLWGVKWVLLPLLARRGLEARMCIYPCLKWGEESTNNMPAAQNWSVRDLVKLLHLPTFLCSTVQSELSGLSHCCSADSISGGWDMRGWVHPTWVGERTYLSSIMYNPVMKGIQSCDCKQKLWLRRIKWQSVAHCFPDSR